MTTTGDDVLLERLAAFADELAGFVARCPAGAQRRRPAGGGFSLVEHLCHLRDLEREGFLVRIVRIVDEDLPELAEIDGSTLAVERHYQQQDADAALRDWRDARATTVSMLRAQLARHGDRKGIFGGFGVITLRMLAEGIMAHDRSHLEALRDLYS